MNHSQGKAPRTLKKAVSTSFTRSSGFEPESNAGRHYQRTNQSNGLGSKSSSLRVRSRKARARESTCSRNSTVSIMEYLAARKRLEDSANEENLVPLSEYGRNCHVSLLCLTTAFSDPCMFIAIRVRLPTYLESRQELFMPRSTL